MEIVDLAGPRRGTFARKIREGNCCLSAFGGGYMPHAPNKKELSDFSSKVLNGKILREILSHFPRKCSSWFWKAEAVLGAHLGRELSHLH